MKRRALTYTLRLALKWLGQLGDRAIVDAVLGLKDGR